MKLKLSFNYIIIIFILMGVLGSVFIEITIRNRRRQARDKIRKSDLVEIQNGLEAFVVDYNHYPKASSLEKDLVPYYLKSLPRDPKEGANYEYIPSGNPPSSYQIKALLENKKDPDPRVKNGYFILQNRQ